MVIDFTLTEEQQELRTTFRHFMADHATPYVEAVRQCRDPLARGQIYRPFVEAAVEAGLMKKMVPVPLGGGSTGPMDHAVMLEEVMAVEPSFALVLAACSLALSPVWMAGTPEQVQRLTAPFLADSGAPTAALCFSEPGGSANYDAPPPAAGTRTTARLEGEEWVIDGEKQWAGYLGGWDGKGADVTSLVCRTDSGLSIIVAERAHLAAGFTQVEAIDVAGHRSAITPRVRFDGVRVPKNNLIGAEGQGAALCKAAFTGSAASVGVASTAVMRRAFDIAFEFARTHDRGGAGPIIDHQAVGHALANAKMRMEAVRSLTWRALWALSIGHPGGAELALDAKVFASETAVQVVTDLIYVVGVEAYRSEFGLTESLIDAIGYPIMEGSNVGMRRRELHDLMRTEGWHPLQAAGMV